MKYANAEICYICEKSFNTNKKSKYYKNYKKVRDHYTGKYRGSAHSLCNLSLSEQRDIPIMLHNGSNYDFHLLMKDLAKENLKNIRCLGENTEKYISFSVKINNSEYDEEAMDEYKKPLSYCLRFIDSFRFMSRSLDTLTDNLPEINNKTCVKCKEREKSTQYCEFVGLDLKRLKYKCLKCNEISYKPIQQLIDKFSSTYRLCNNDNKKFMHLLRKGVHPYECMDNWNRFNENVLPSKDNFYSNLHMENVFDKNYQHAKNVWNIFNMSNLGDYHDLYVQSDTLLLSYLFEECRKTCIRDYELDPCYFVSAPGLSWQVCLKESNVKLELLTDIDMLLMLEKGIREGISQAILKHAKANNKCMKNFNKK